ncbi:cation:proton antiporter [Gordonia terrae]|uniref:cation:proton antiporter n=1 Tax=Gordonia terrae TaxID=2055 RepID=UPI002009F08B|nr:cation:proton antiporter [Gordonia terrae]UPW07785.1 cation:proton antiporter [Gordonia terrae]
MTPAETLLVDTASSGPVLVLAESGDSATSVTVSLFWIALVAVISPLLSRMSRGYVPDAVLLLGFGILIGPHALDVASQDGIDVLSQLGLGMLFLLAGYELDPKLLGGRTGRIAQISWLVSLLIALAAVTLVAVTLALGLGETGFTAHVAVAIALSSTALGTLLPILKQAGLERTRLGRAVMAHGAVGELGPVVAMSLLLTSRSIGAAVVVLLLFAIAALLISAAPQRILARVPGIGAAIREAAGGTVQLPVRVVVLLLVSLMTVASVFDLDVVLGAFAAGLILRRLIGPEHPQVGTSLEVIGFGILIPIFFVTSGMNIDVSAVASEPGLWVVLILAIAIARGGPVWAGAGRLDDGYFLRRPRERTQLAFFAATGLPIIVAVTQVAVASELMSDELASILVAAGATTVLLFPLIARLIGRATPTAAPTTTS